MRILRVPMCLLALLAGLLPAKAAFDVAEARQLIAKYRNQWIADPDKIRDARIGAIYDIPFVGTAVCVAIDRLLVSGNYSGLEPLVVIINKLDVTPAPVVFQPPPKTTYEFRVTAAPPDMRCAEEPMAPFPQLRNAGARLRR